MGDRTWLHLTVSEHDVGLVKGICVEETDPGPKKRVTLIDSDVNWGGANVMESCIAKKIPFIAHHGAGNNYGEAVVAFDGAEEMEVAALDGDFIVRVSSRGNPDKKQLRDVQRFVRLQRETLKAIDARKPQPKDEEPETSPIPVVCDNCDWSGDADDVVVGLEDVPSLGDRIVPGGIVPYGECPKCGTLCYLANKDVAD